MVQDNDVLSEETEQTKTGSPATVVGFLVLVGFIAFVVWFIKNRLEESE